RSLCDWSSDVCSSDLYSGAVEAWVVDALDASGYTGTIDHVMARGSTISSAAMLVGTVSGGLLGNLNLTFPYLARSVLLLIAFGIALVTMHDVGFDVRAIPLRDIPAEMMRIGRESVRFGWDMRRARLAIIAGARPALFLEA